MAFRDRIIDFRRVRAADLIRNPKNWRVHPPGQRQALSAMIERIGFADAVITRQLPSGELMLGDGHLRADMDPDAEIPTLVTDLTEQELNELMATLDPLASMAETDAESLRALLDTIEDLDPLLKSTLDDLVDGSEWDWTPDTVESVEPANVPMMATFKVQCKQDDAEEIRPLLQEAIRRFEDATLVE